MKRTRGVRSSASHAATFSDSDATHHFQFAHLQCAFFIGEAAFDIGHDNEENGGIGRVCSISADGTRGSIECIPRARFQLRCDLCRTRKGAVAQCNISGCTQGVHPGCSVFATNNNHPQGWLLELAEDDNEHHIVRCPKHAAATTTTTTTGSTCRRLKKHCTGDGKEVLEVRNFSGLQQFGGIFRIRRAAGARRYLFLERSSGRIFWSAVHTDLHDGRSNGSGILLSQVDEETSGGDLFEIRPCQEHQAFQGSGAGGALGSSSSSSSGDRSQWVISGLQGTVITAQSSSAGRAESSRRRLSLTWNNPVGGGGSVAEEHLFALKSAVGFNSSNDGAAVAIECNAGQWVALASGDVHVLDTQERLQTKGAAKDSHLFILELGRNSW
jgi:hypothetical protein